MKRLMTRRQMTLLMATGAATLALGGCSQTSTPEEGATSADTSKPDEEAQSAESASETTEPANEATNTEKPQAEEPETEAEPEAAPETAAANVMVLYFSLPEATSTANMTEAGENSTVTIDGEVLGNIQYLAQLIADQTNGELIRVEAVDPYPIEDHDQLTSQAQEELNAGYRPEITGAPTPEQIEAADVIFLGHPIWWANLPTPVYTLLESINLSGKTVIPFVCHGGSGFASTRETIAQLQPNADFQGDNGFLVSRDVVADSASDVGAWLNGLGFEIQASEA